mmetsp:Transcript_6311/g.20091  ORF Transcript_6311/g.20091 Transcript_6311/m.20091 type:complete len:254 (-) Transcript_6311:5-766(-)
MLTALRSRYGEKLCELEDGVGPHFAFPPVAALAAASESDLRALGLGYRAKYVLGTARAVASHPPGWLASLRSRPREEVQAALVALPGVGAKVADCVALFSLDQLDAIPVDVHVWNIACRDMDASLSSARSLTPRIYQHVGDLFRARFQPHAGWAHSVLFTAELADFAHHLPASLAASMREFKRQEREAKAAQRKARKARRAGEGTKAEGEAQQGEVEQGEVQQDGGPPSEVDAAAGDATAGDAPTRKRRRRKE